MCVCVCVRVMNLSTRQKTVSRIPNSITLMMIRNAITQSIKRDVETLQHVLENIRIGDVRRDVDRLSYVNTHTHKQS